MDNNDNVIEFPKVENPLPTPTPDNEPRIIIFQVVSPSQCVFACLKEDENDGKLELGIIKR